MNKKIKVILKTNKKSNNNEDQLIEVTKGYALNYLIPNELAEIATKKKIKHLLMLKEIHNKEIEKNKLQAAKIKQKLIQINNISINKKMGDNYNIFGNINEKDIIEKIFKFTSIKLEKKQINIPQMKKIGIFYININLFSDKFYELPINIMPSNI